MNPITISALTTRIVKLLREDELLKDAWITGEVSSWTRARSGHIYFTLKDSGATLSSVMWKGNAYRHSWLPDTGDQILAHGYVDVYPDRGVYQFYADEIRPAGRGQLYAQFEALKEKLAGEGLFDAERKRAIPRQPLRIGVVTSREAAALRDVLRTLSSRWPLIDVILFPSLVQGAEAPAQIVAALEAANAWGRSGSLFDGAPLDTILLVRGGGSIEDLWAFNDERVAYAVAESEIPVIAGVGHETDFTIVDFVADLRAPTPTAAAAAAVPDRREFGAALLEVRERLIGSALDQVDRRWERFAEIEQRLTRLHPGRHVDRFRQQMDESQIRLSERIERRLMVERSRLEADSMRLQALNPRRILESGYSIVRRGDGSVVRGAEDALSGEELQVIAHRGEYSVTKLP